mmetsp:Transcript_12368/g.25231  ORF Transcript_12368/g.25231 Transcript_12368/m.25231 type:complete len:99 (+) Transcript_12368:951-1247(+)
MLVHLSRVIPESAACADLTLARCPQVPTSFESVGHIVHLNLRDEHEPYKAVIGQVLLDKVKGSRTVVNKVDSTGGNQLLSRTGASSFRTNSCVGGETL